jgi:hypothetical protein
MIRLPAIPITELPREQLSQIFQKTGSAPPVALVKISSKRPDLKFSAPVLNKESGQLFFHLRKTIAGEREKNGQGIEYSFACDRHCFFTDI